MGRNSFNIAELHMGRSDTGGWTIGAIMVDQDIPNEIINELKAIPDVINVKRISFS